MKVPKEGQGIGASLFPILDKLPVLSRYAKTRGWFYVISWLHRFTGIWLFVAFMVHMVALSSWQTPNVFNVDMKIPGQPIFVFLALVSSLVVGFHALNGGRLILYELFGRRNDADMIRWIFGLTAGYAAMIGLMMMKNQHASTFFFWLMAFFSGAIAAYAIASRIWINPHSLLWKLQRISGGFLFTTVPAYLLFLYLNPSQTETAHGAIVWIQNGFTRMAILIVTILMLYHAGYGLFSIAADYIFSKKVLTGMTAIVIAVIVVLFVFAVRIILPI